MLKKNAYHAASHIPVLTNAINATNSEYPNVKGIVMEVTTEGMHKIGTEHGVLNNLFAANCVTPCREAFLSLENVPDKTVSLRTAANSSAMGTGQGIFKCGCKQKCNSTRCKCFKSNVKCNSKCHSSMPCDNKHDQLFMF
ncbi:hypothetical protein DdX_00996 [Ditylenchus destructor]|uniref:CRC domain-containing protein n=1 Tax=Ditylenchus destructor TaxID=166010 RepID=A0AAD4RAW3_9BILA|nr:hypothetical protein DdX_00996 [Ditylenchus destructor]